MTTTNIGRPRRADRSQTRFGVAAVVPIAVFAGFAFSVAACGGDDDQVSAEFTGDDCVYSGPTEFEVGDEFEITVVDVTEERRDVGYAVTKVPDGTSVDDVLKDGFIDSLPEGPGTFLWSEVTEEGTERLMSTSLDVAGTWLVHCFDLTTPEGETLPATTFEVVEKS